MKRGPKPGCRVPLPKVCTILVLSHFNWPQHAIASEANCLQSQVSRIAIRYGFRRFPYRGGRKWEPAPDYPCVSRVEVV